MQQPATGFGYAPQVRYGGFWIRLVAIIIDGLIVGIPVGIVSGIVSAAVAVSSNNNSQAGAAALPRTQLLADLIGFALEIAYFVDFCGRGETLAMPPFPL